MASRGPRKVGTLALPYASNLPSHRSHVSIGWGPLMTVVTPYLTDDWWCNATIWGEALAHAPQAGIAAPRGDLLPDGGHEMLRTNVAADHPDPVVEELIGLAIADAGGEIPAQFAEFKDRPGCTPYLTGIQKGGDYVARRR